MNLDFHWDEPIRQGLLLDVVPWGGRSSRRPAAESLGEAVFFTRVFNFRYVEFSILGCTF